MNITLTKQLNNTFKTTYSSDYELLKKIKTGIDLSCDIKQIRNLKLHKKAFVLLDLVYNNQEKYTNKEHLRKVLTILSGFTNEIILPNGEIILEAKSWKFSKMKESDFNDLYRNMVNVVVKEFVFDKEELLKEVSINF